MVPVSFHKDFLVHYPRRGKKYIEVIITLGRHAAFLILAPPCFLTNLKVLHIILYIHTTFDIKEQAFELPPYSDPHPNFSKQQVTPQPFGESPKQR